jgi:hypothetical protein
MFNTKTKIMKTLQDYQNLKKELEEIRTNHKGESLDPSFICVRNIGLNWRECKKIGMEKSAYYGWIFYSTSTNSNGYDLFQRIEKACEGFNLFVSDRQL